jgi:GNAT superfamily N-acetyltransferase
MTMGSSPWQRDRGIRRHHRDVHGDEPLEILPALPEDVSTVGRVLGVHNAHFYAERLSRDSVVLVARRTRDVAGAVCASWAPADEPEIREHLARVPLLYRLYVLRDLRRRGIGTALVEHAERLLRDRGHRAVAVGVDPDNEPALALYAKLGYREWKHGLIPTHDQEYADDWCTVYVKDLA